MNVVVVVAMVMVVVAVVTTAEARPFLDRQEITSGDSFSGFLPPGVPRPNPSLSHRPPPRKKTRRPPFPVPPRHQRQGGVKKTEERNLAGFMKSIRKLIREVV